MAEAADFIGRGWAAALFEDLTAFPGRFPFAIRLAVICSLTALVCEIYQTPEAALTVYIAFFLNKPDRVASLILNVVMVALITILIGIIFLFANGVLDRPFRLVASMTLISLLVLFVASASKLSSVGGTLALILGYGLDALGQVPLGELATRALFYAWLLVGIPAGVSMVVNLLIAPSPRSLVQQALAWRLRLAATMLRRPDAATRKALTEALREGDAEMRQRVKLAGLERTSPAGDLAALGRAATSSVVLLTLIDTADRDPSARPPEPVELAIARVLDEAASTFAVGAYPVGINVMLAPEARRDISPRAAALLDRLVGLLATFVEPPRPDPAASPGGEKAGGGFFKPDALSNPDYIHYAVKTTAAAMICYVLYQLLDWSSIHTCMITCYIVSLGTMAETVEKLGLRIFGCMVGAAAGIASIVFLVPQLTSIGALMAAVFLGVLPAAWVAVGNPRVGYAGYQIAFALLLCLIQGNGPSFDMVTARDRVIGILIGNLVVFVIAVTAWPVSVGARIDAGIGRVLGHLRDVLTAQGPERARLATAAAQQGLGMVGRDLELIAYEPSDIRPPAAWVARRARVAEALAALCGPLLLSTRANTAGNVASRLGALIEPTGGSGGMKPIPVPDRSAAAGARTTPFALEVNLQLGRIEAEFQPESETIAGGASYAAR